MASANKGIQGIAVSRLFLALDNPRFKPVHAEAKAIETLCTKEDVYPLARDIAIYGTNPLEIFALVPTDETVPDGPKSTYFVAEGNRRLCAIKLLNDPDLAPPKLRQSFEKLASEWDSIDTVNGIVFRDKATLRHWRDRIHNGFQGGTGRKPWDADQKSRNDGESKNRPALALLDYAEREGMITSVQRERKLTTVQRFLSNVVFRETIGIDLSNNDNIGINRPKQEFDVITRKFVKDLVSGKSVNSRMNQDAIIAYARPLNSLPGVSSKRIPTESITQKALSTPQAGVTKSPKKPERLKHIQYESEIASALDDLGNEKLKSLYYSITKIDLEDHTPLLTVGTWAFFETLTSCAGRNDGTSFDSFLSKTRLTQYGIKGEFATFRSALERIRDYGNTTKHHKVGASLNGDQLNNDIVTLSEIILKCIADAGSKKP